MATHHVATLLAPAWGHTVSYIHLATQLLNADPTLVISILQHNMMVPQMKKELSSCSYDTTRLRVLGVGANEIPDFSPMSIKLAFEQLISGWFETLPQLVQGTEGWPKPRAIHLDFLAGGPVVDNTKKLAGPECKILAWFCSAAATMIGSFNDYDFTAIAQEIYADDGRRGGRTFDEILQQVAIAWNGSDRLNGTIIKNPGVPDMYDHERVPFGAGPPVNQGPLLLSAQKLGKVVDGFIVTSGVYYEPVGVPYCREYYGKRGQELFAVGMQTHESLFADNTGSVPSNEVVKKFLDSAMDKYGPNSVLYISFGSLFFPIATPQLVEALLNTLLELEQPFPFILALGGIMASLPKELVGRVNTSGKGLVCESWVEQHAILQSPAVGWFLTHGGFNSVIESLTRGIPLIIWAISAEQPINAAYLSAPPNPVAIELLQIRTGPQLGPSLRHGGDITITGTVEDASTEFRTVFAAARGSQGAILRANAENLSNVMREARRGECAEEVLRLAKF